MEVMGVDLAQVVAPPRVELLLEVSLFLREFSSAPLALALSDVGARRESDLARSPLQSTLSTYTSCARRCGIEVRSVELGYAADEVLLIGLCECEHDL